MQIIISAIDNASKVIKKVEDSVKNASGKIKEMSMHVAKAGAIMSGISAPFIAGMAKSIQTGMDFEQQMKKVQAVLGGTQDDFKKLSDYAVEMGNQTVFSASEVAQAMYNMAMAGMKTDDIMSSLKATLDMASATQIDLSQASDIVVSTLAQYNLKASEASRVADVFAAAVTNANMDMTNLQYAMKYVGPIAHSLGYSLEDTVAALMDLHDAGIKGEKAGTSLREIFTRLLNPTKSVMMVLEKYNLKLYKNWDSIQKVRKAYEKAKETLNMLERNNAPTSQIAAWKYNVEQLKQKYEQLAVTGLVSFDKIIGRLKKAHIAQGDLVKLFGAEPLTAVQTLISSHGVEKYRGNVELLKKSAGTSAKMSAEMVHTVSGAIKLIKSHLESIEIQVFKDLKPEIVSILDTITASLPTLKEFVELFIKGFKEALDYIKPIGRKIQEMFGNLSPNVKKTIALVAGLGVAFAAIAGPALLAIGGLLTGFGSIVEMISLIIGVVGGISASTLFPVVEAIGAIILALYALKTMWDNDLGGFRTSIITYFHDLKIMITWVANKIKNALNPVLKKHTDIIQKFKKVGMIALTVLGKAFAQYLLMWIKGWKALKKAYDKNLFHFRDFVNGIGKLTVFLVDELLKTIEWILNSIIWLYNNWSTIWKKTINTINGFVNYLMNIAKFIANMLVSIANFVIGVWDKMIKAIENSVNGIIKTINDMVSWYNDIAKHLGLPTLAYLKTISLEKYTVQKIDTSSLDKLFNKISSEKPSNPNIVNNITIKSPKPMTPSKVAKEITKVNRQMLGGGL